MLDAILQFQKKAQNEEKARPSFCPFEGRPEKKENTFYPCQEQVQSSMKGKEAETIWKRERRKGNYQERSIGDSWNKFHVDSRKIRI